jgi:MFS family permease
MVMGAVSLVVVGVVVGGPIGGLAALGGLGLAGWRGYRTVGAAALVALVVAALLTVLEAPATGDAPDYLFDFALDRPLAATAGLVAGVLTLVAVALAALHERAPTSPVNADPEATPSPETPP